MVDYEDSAQLIKERASEIFQNVFKEIFLANCGNPVDFETVRTEIVKSMKIEFDETSLWNLEQFFNEEDTENKNALTKEQMRTYLLKCLQEGLFAEFFAKKDNDLHCAVQALYQDHFEEAFSKSETKGSLDKFTLIKLIADRFAGEDNLIEQLTNELEKQESPEAGENQVISEAAVKISVRAIVKSLQNQQISQRDDQEALIEEYHQTTGGGYAREKIQRIISGFKETGLLTSDPFQEMQDVFDLFYADQQINNYDTMVCGNDLCEMLGLFYDMTEAINIINEKKVAEMEKYKIAYNNRVRRDKRREQEQKEEEEKKKTQVQEDDQFSLLRKHNTKLMNDNGELQMQMRDLTETQDLLMQENDEKDRLIEELELDLKEKSHHTESLTKETKLASQEAKDREAKIAQVKIERDMKEKEAAAHLGLVEQKAKRVDELERQQALLDMDKDQMKREINRLKDQLDGLQDAGGQGVVKPKKASDFLQMPSFNPMAQSGRNRNMTAMKANNRVSAPLGGIVGLKVPRTTSELKGLDPNRPKVGRPMAFSMPTSGPLNVMAQSQRSYHPAGAAQNMNKDDDMMSEFQPPANDFYNRAARLSVWSRSDVPDFIVDGHSEDQSESSGSVRRISDNDSFGGRSNNNSMAGLSRGSMSSTGSKGIRNFLGGKFAKRAESIKKQNLAASGRARIGMVPGQAAPMGNRGADMLERNTILEDMDSDIDASMCSMDAKNFNYDIVGLKEESCPYFNAVKSVLEIHNKRTKEFEEDEFDAVKAIQSKLTLAVEIQIYMQMTEPQQAVFVVANDVAIFLFKKSKSVVVSPFKIHDARDLVLAENVPSACAIQVDEDVEGKIGRSHLIFESKSMGLIMRYVLEREYDMEVDFCDSLPVRIMGDEKDFCFTELEQVKKVKENSENNGVVRCTVNSTLYIFDDGGMFGSDAWKPIQGIMTNLGLLRYTRQNPLQNLPKIMRLGQLVLTPLKGEFKGRRNVFRLDYLNDKEKMSEKYFSVESSELFNLWIAKITLTIQEYKQMGNAILKPIDQRTDKDNSAPNEFTVGHDFEELKNELVSQSTRRSSKRVAQTPMGRIKDKFQF